jgi:Icc-related predicted phosphoesterase
MKIVAISDTHLVKSLPDILKGIKGDILIHAGDALSYGNKKEWTVFLKQLIQVRNQFRYVIYVPGNHDGYVDDFRGECYADLKPHNIHMLIDEVISLPLPEHETLTIFGSPYTPKFGNWWFQYERFTNRWKDAIPKNCDIVVTHGPRQGILDRVFRPDGSMVDRVGCDDLADAIDKARPGICISGHLHGEAGGYQEFNGTKYYNVSICNDFYFAECKPTIIEVD